MPDEQKLGRGLLFHEFKCGILVIIKRRLPHIKTTGQVCYGNLENWGVGDGGLQDKLTSGVINGNSLYVELGVEDIQ